MDVDFNGKKIYQWTNKDKILYALALFQFLLAFFGATLILAKISIFLVLIYLGFYILGNFFQAGACTGCPYKGKYCPPIFGVYLGNILSRFLYKHKEFNAKFIHKQGKIAEYILYLVFLFPVYWLFTTKWYLTIIYFLLLLLHLMLFMPTQCEKCSYNERCPGGITWNSCKSLLFQKKLIRTI
ncbi:hypothetical protein [Candidatus Harpocratesius sp.]